MKNKSKIRHASGKNIQFFKLYAMLFKDPIYAKLSLEAKVLYSIMRSRCELSAKEGWEENGRVYIFFTIGEIMKVFQCGTAKAVRILDELDKLKGIGLIERKKQGRGFPSKIFVLDIISPENVTAENCQCENSSGNIASNPETETCQNENSKLSESETQEFSDSKPINNDKKYKNNNYKDISQSSNDSENHFKQNSVAAEMIERREMYRNVLKANINYPVLINQCGNIWLDEIVELMLGVICSQKDTVKIGGEMYPSAVVKERYLELNEYHIEYVYHIINSVSGSIKNMREYIRTSLYNSPETADSWMRARVKAEIRSGSSAVYSG